MNCIFRKWVNAGTLIVEFCFCVFNICILPWRYSFTLLNSVYFWFSLADVDECSSSSSNPCTQNCTNGDGNFTCSCTSGYRLGSDGFTCEGNIDTIGRPFLKIVTHTSKGGREIERERERGGRRGGREREEGEGEGEREGEIGREMERERRESVICAHSIVNGAMSFSKADHHFPNFTPRVIMLSLKV